MKSKPERQTAPGGEAAFPLRIRIRIRQNRRANPDYLGEHWAVYVGMTGLEPDVRFDKHKAGIQSNRYAREYGLRLLPALYQVYNPMPYEAARDMEVELGIGLREAGYAVWQA